MAGDLQAFATIILGGLLFVLINGCAPEQKNQAARMLIESIEHSDNNVTTQESLEERDRRLRRDSEILIGKIDSVSSLKEAYEACEAKSTKWDKAGQPPTHYAQVAILERLGKMATGEAARALVELYENKQTKPDGEMALWMGEAITRCGKVALPYLRQIENYENDLFVQDLVNCINKGEIFGP